MKAYTRLTNLDVTGELAANQTKIKGVTAATFAVTAADATVTLDTAPTAAEFASAVTLLNELKAKHNKLVTYLRTGSAT